MDNETIKVNINKATIEELTHITGIGEGLAGRIIEYRETVHPFEEVIELAAVPGISERMARKFADWVTVEPVVVLEKTAVSPSILSLDPVEDMQEIEKALASELEEAARTEIELAELEPELEIAEELAIEAVVAEEMASEDAIPEVEVAEPEPALALEEGVEAELELVEQKQEPELELEEILPEMELVEPTLEPEPEEEVIPEAELVSPEPELELEVAAAVSEPEPIPAEPSPAPVPAPTPAPRPRRALGAILLGSILGACVGALITLAILAALNGGTLTFTQADARLRTEINAAQQIQDDLSQSIDSLDTELNNNLGAIATRTGEMVLQQQETSQSLQEINAAVAELEEMSEELDERLANVAVAAESFDAFLEGMRNLLVDLQGMPVPTRTPYATPMPKSTITVTSEADDAGVETETSPITPTSTGQPTRTPRPTATSISLPTSTPGQQP